MCRSFLEFTVILLKQLTNKYSMFRGMGLLLLILLHYISKMSTI